MNSQYEFIDNILKVTIEKSGSFHIHMIPLNSVSDIVSRMYKHGEAPFEIIIITNHGCKVTLIEEGLDLLEASQYLDKFIIDFNRAIEESKESYVNPLVDDISTIKEIAPQIEILASNI